MTTIFLSPFPYHATYKDRFCSWLLSVNYNILCLHPKAMITII